MKGSSEDNDTLPEAVIYFYPRDEQIKKQRELDCGELVGFVQYFEHDLFQLIPKTFYFQNSIVVHQYYGRHSGFLSLPNDRYTNEEAQIHLKHIMDLFNTLYGTWNHVCSTYGKDNKLNEFLNQALTPIVDYVCNRTPSILHFFSIVEYATLKQDNQRVLLESKHCLDYLKSKYGLRDGLIGYDNKALYSTWNPETTFYLQLIFQLKKHLPKNLIHAPWESELKLKNGVSLFRVYLPQSSKSTPNAIPTGKIPNITTRYSIPTSPPILTRPISIFESMSSSDLSTSSSLSSLKNLGKSFDYSPSSSLHRRRLGLLFPREMSGSSEETGFETDLTDEQYSSSAPDAKSVSSESANESSFPSSMKSNKDTRSFTSLPFGFDEPIPDDDKIELYGKPSFSRSSTSNEMEETIKRSPNNSLTESANHTKNSTDSIVQIQIVAVDRDETLDDNDDEDDDDENTPEEIPVISRQFSQSIRDRTATVTSNPDLYISRFMASDRHDLQVSWKNISDKNKELERDELVLYVQKNSRMMFAGVIHPSLLTEEYLKTLWGMMLEQMANMETEIQATSTHNELTRATTDTKFQYTESTHFAEFERAIDASRQYRKIPSEESSHLALLTNVEFQRNPDCKLMGLSRGNHLISVDRSLPNRTNYSCRRYQETF